MNSTWREKEYVFRLHLNSIVHITHSDDMAGRSSVALADDQSINQLTRDGTQNRNIPGVLASLLQLAHTLAISSKMAADDINLGVIFGGKVKSREVKRNTNTYTSLPYQNSF